METKKCNKCGDVKKLEDFVLKKSNKSGVAAFCKSCGNASRVIQRNQRIVSDQRYKEKLTLMYAKSSRTPIHKYNEYRSNANTREHYFDLTFEQFMIFWQKPCSHCGSSIETIGLDRIDNSIGYTLSNIKSCCCVCNRAKYNMTEKEFLEWAERVVVKSKKAVN